MTAKLTICGLGIDRPQDATLGTVQALKESDAAFYIHLDGELMEPFLRTFCSDVRLCREPKFDAPTIERKIELVAADVCAELEKGRRVAYVTYGHPLTFSDGFNVAKICKAAGHDCRVLPAPSSVDSIIASVGELNGPFSNSYVVLSADAALAKPQALTLQLPVVIMGVDAAASRGLYGRLCGLIESGYPSGAQAYGVRCRDGHNEPVLLRGHVADVRRWEKKIVHMMSLVVHL